jgi:uncharacterized protein (TIGR03435 family)
MTIAESKRATPANIPRNQVRSGTFDFSLDWSLAPDSAQPLGSQLEDPGPTFLEALRQQLGLTLKSTKGPVDVLVIDYVEHPTAD